MQSDLPTLVEGYRAFKQKYAQGDFDLMKHLAEEGQAPKTMVVACSDSRVDPALILQCDPGDLFVVRNVANIVPPYESNEGLHHGTSAALEFGICYLHISRLVVLGHSQCGGIQAHLEHLTLHQDDFISSWLDLLQNTPCHSDPNIFAQLALLNSYQNLLSFPWIKSRIEDKTLEINLWYFEIKTATLLNYDFNQHLFVEFG